MDISEARSVPHVDSYVVPGSRDGLMNHPVYPSALSSFFTKSSLCIFFICVSSNFSPLARRIFRSSIALTFFNRPRTLLSCRLAPLPGVFGLVACTSGVSATEGGVVVLVVIGVPRCWMVMGPFMIPFCWVADRCDDDVEVVVSPWCPRPRLLLRSGLCRSADLASNPGGTTGAGTCPLLRLVSRPVPCPLVSGLRLGLFFPG
jgi:hypothetical protein